MPYWGSKSDENDFAFDALGVYIEEIKDRMFKDIRNVIEKSYPEQSLIVSLKCIRLLALEFPKCVRVSFRKKHYRDARDLFDDWLGLVRFKLPENLAMSIEEEARREFRLFEEQVLGSN